MPAWDLTTNGTWSKHKYLWDLTANGTWTKEKYAYDLTVSGTWSLVYKAQVTVTLSNLGVSGGGKYSWNDSGSLTQYIDLGNVPNQRCWVRAGYGGWAYGSANVKVTHAGNIVSGPIDINGGNTTWKSAFWENIVTWNYGTMQLVTARYGATQGQTGLTEALMIVPLDELDNALGRQSTLGEIQNWFGTNWTGSKTVTIQL